MRRVIIKNATIVNEGETFVADVLIVNNRIEKIANTIDATFGNFKIINAEGLHLLPGLIDDQVHFREPGLTQKATVYSESRAAVAGGITSFMDMPNTIPNTTSLNLLEEKYLIAKSSSLANYSFFMGITKHNLEEALKIDNEQICGLTDDGLYFNNNEGILANYPEFLEQLFSRTNSLVALHCEDDEIIDKNTALFRKQYGVDIPAICHSLIRDEQACFEATKRVVEIAKKYNTRFHAYHISTELETHLFKYNGALRDKRITSEACVHHLWFTDNDYDRLGHFIKWNPSIKSENNKLGLIKALNNNIVDIIATDHAPHLLSEKKGDYFQSKSGGPLVQHALVTLLELYHQGYLSLEKIVEKTSHHVAEIYRMFDRGYIREGYFADIVLVDLNDKWKSTSNLNLYKCGWSPFDNYTFSSKVIQTYVNGHLAYDRGVFNNSELGRRLLFEKNR
ncbi:MAG: dihydroorotase [Bacteroidia bacterium]|nr:dihydroorotase [Bacteroidia bacterium]